MALDRSDANTHTREGKETMEAHELASEGTMHKILVSSNQLFLPQLVAPTEILSVGGFHGDLEYH